MIIGLTGGIGSGKTAVSDYFSAKGITIVDADVVSRKVVEPGTQALNEIEQHFGAEVINDHKELDRRALRNKIFDNTNERKWLENLLHPLIAEEILRQLNASQSPYSILVSPLLFEAGQVKMVCRTLVVDAPKELQISRTIARDSTDEAGVKSIIATQMRREERLAKADDIIVNDKDLNHLQYEVSKLYESYLHIATSNSK